MGLELVEAFRLVAIIQPICRAQMACLSPAMLHALLTEESLSNASLLQVSASVGR